MTARGCYCGMCVDNHFAIGKHLHMYRHDCSAQFGIPDFSCLSTVGWIITVVCTYTGYICMIVGMLWAVEIKKKIITAFRQIRRAQRAKAQVQAEASQQPLLESTAEDV